MNQGVPASPYRDQTMDYSHQQIFVISLVEHTVDLNDCTGYFNNPCRRYQTGRVDSQANGSEMGKEWQRFNYGQL